MPTSKPYLSAVTLAGAARDFGVICDMSGRAGREG